MGVKFPFQLINYPQEFWSFCTENVGYHHMHLYIHQCIHMMCSWACVCVYISKPKYLHTYCTVMKHQRLLLTLQFVSLLSCPTSACSSLSDCPAWKAALLTLVRMNCSIITPCPCYDQVSAFRGFVCMFQMFALPDLTTGMWGQWAEPHEAEKSSI